MTITQEETGLTDTSLPNFFFSKIFLCPHFIISLMEIYPAEISPVNVNNIVNNTQDMEGVEYINVDKENSDNLISTYLAISIE